MVHEHELEQHVAEEDQVDDPVDEEEGIAQRGVPVRDMLVGSDRKRSDPSLWSSGRHSSGRYSSGSSQSLTTLSYAPEASRRPSGENARAVTLNPRRSSEWPGRVNSRGSARVVSHNLIWP